MTYDAQLQELQEKIARFRHLDAGLKELYSQRKTLSAHVRELDAAKRSEEADVEKLEGRSLAVLFYTITGKRDELLTRERQEACTARVKYEAAAKELQDIDEDISRYRRELNELRDCESAYAAVLREKRTALKAAGGQRAEEILQLEERCAFLRSHQKELSEAISAGKSARSTADSILQSLVSSERREKPRPCDSVTSAVGIHTLQQLVIERHHDAGFLLPNSHFQPLCSVCIPSYT